MTELGNVNRRLISSIRYGNEFNIIKALEDGADINFIDNNGKSPLTQAVIADAMDGTTRTFILLEWGADPNFNAPQPLLEALYYSNEKTVKYLLDYGAEPNYGFPYSIRWNDIREDGNVDPLSYLFLESDCEEVLESKAYNITKLLIKAGAYVNIPLYTFSRRRPLMCALMGKCNFKIVKLLLEHGAQVNTRDSNGNTPLIYAIKYGCPFTEDGYKIVKLLLQHGAIVNSKNNDGETAITFLDNPLCFSDEDDRYWKQSYFDNAVKIMKLLEKKGGKTKKLYDKLKSNLMDTVLRSAASASSSHNGSGSSSISSISLASSMNQSQPNPWDTQFVQNSLTFLKTIDPTKTKQDFMFLNEFPTVLDCKSLKKTACRRSKSCVWKRPSRGEPKSCYDKSQSMFTKLPTELQYEIWRNLQSQYNYIPPPHTSVVSSDDIFGSLFL